MLGYRASRSDADGGEHPHAALRDLLGQRVVELGQLQPILLRDLPAARIVRILAAIAIAIAIGQVRSGQVM